MLSICCMGIRVNLSFHSMRSRVRRKSKNHLLIILIMLVRIEGKNTKDPQAFGLLSPRCLIQKQAKHKKGLDDSGYSQESSSSEGF
jgi:hypothetical protein